MWKIGDIPAGAKEDNHAVMEEGVSVDLAACYPSEGREELLVQCTHTSACGNLTFEP